MLDELGDVVLEDLGEGFVGPGSRRGGHPGREFGLPDQVVAADCFAGLFGDVDEVVAASEVEDVLFGFGELELYDLKIVSRGLGD